MSSPDLSILGLTQRVTIANAATSDANGNITFKIGPCPLGSVWEGTVTIINSPTSAQYNLAVLDINWGTFIGLGPYGPVQLYGQETLTITGTGMAMNTQYTARFLGASHPEQYTDPIYPVALSAGSTGPRTAGTASFVGGSGTFIFAGLQTTDNFLEFCSSGSLNPIIIQSVIGTQSGVVYLQDAILAGAIAVGQFRTGCPVFGSLDTSVNITAVGTGNFNIKIVASPIPIPEPVLPVFVTQLIGIGATTNFSLLPINVAYIRLLACTITVYAVGIAAGGYFITGVDPFNGGTVRPFDMQITGNTVVTASQNFGPNGVILQTTIPNPIRANLITPGVLSDDVLIYQPIA